MNTKLTKIKETEILSAVPESGHVMAEVDGVVKRVPGNKVGGVPDGGEAGQVLTKTEEGAAWTTPESGLPEGGEPYKQLVTDASGNAVWEDRLAWKEERLHFIYDEWFEFCKISDEVPGVIPETIAITIASPDGTTENKDVRVVQSSDNAFLYQFWWVVIAKEDNATYSSDVTHIVFPEKGVYLLKQLDTGSYLAKATWDGQSYEWDGTFKNIKPIDPPLIGGWKALGESVPVETEIVASQTLTYADGGDGSGMGVVQNPFALDLKDGITYKVTWDGTEYESVAYAIEQVICIGNGDFLGLTGYGNNEPYFFYSGAGTVVGACREAGEHTVKIVGMLSDIIPCPREYLPENLCEVVIVDRTKPITTDEALTLLNEAKSGKALFYMTSNKLYYPLHAIEGYPTTHIHLYDTPYHYLAYKPVNGVYDWSESTNVYTGFNASSFTVCDYNEPSAYISVNTGSSGIGGGKSVNVRQSGGVFDTIFIDNTIYFVLKNLVLRSSTEGSTKKFFIKVDDSGTLSATEVT